MGFTPAGPDNYHTQTAAPPRCPGFVDRLCSSRLAGSAVRIRQLWSGEAPGRTKFQLGTLLIHKSSSREFTTQNDLY